MITTLTHGTEQRAWQLNIPGLQWEDDRTCVSCGGVPKAYCARCKVTPYCSQRCQRRDWLVRHKSVCHNLARLSNENGAPAASVVDLVLDAPPAPLRRPRSPALTAKEEPANPKVPVNQRYPPGTYPKQSTRVPRNLTLNSGTAGAQSPDNRNSPRNDSGKDPRGGPGGRNFNRSFDKENGTGPKYNQNRFGAKKWHNNRNERHDTPPVPRDEEVWEVTPAQQDPPKSVVADTKPVEKPKPAAPVPKPSVPEPKPSAPEPKPAEKPAPAVVESKPVEKPKPKSLVPKDCLLDVVSTGDIVILSVESKSSECHTDVLGYVCLSLSENFGDKYSELVDAFAAACEAQPAGHTPTPGETFAILDADGGWYRARCLSPTLVALIDAARVVPLPETHKKLPPAFIQHPEFCCVLQPEGNVQVGVSCKCVLKEKSPAGYKVALFDAETDTAICGGEVQRWVPTVQYPAPILTVPTFAAKTTKPATQPATPPAAQPATPPTTKPATQPATAATGAAAAIPSVPRPYLIDKSKVLLVHVCSMTELYVRSAELSAQRAYDAALHDTASYGICAKPLTEPPTQGQCVVSLYSDGHHYRALVRRTNVKQNKYLLEYVELGLSHISPLEQLYPCPPALTLAKQPASTSRVALNVTSQLQLSEPALQYLDRLKDIEELILTLPSNLKSEPSGAEVILTVAKNKEIVNKKAEEMSTPEWMQLQKRGGDVLETEQIMYGTLEFVPLPPNGGKLIVLDVSLLPAGTLSAAPAGPYMQTVLGPLTDKMREYCESEVGREPYLPKYEELCIAQSPPYPQWFRAVLSELQNGAGGQTAELCFIDYGNTEVVSTSLIRKMLPEFVKGYPALASSLEIRDFPKEPSEEMLCRALEYLEINDEGQGTITITDCREEGPGLYSVAAPDLITAMLCP